jgi:predicted SnoaL-like aldol condensation-catalyzing enzyme
LKHLVALFAICIGFVAAANVHAQEPVVGVPNAEDLFTNKNPKLNRNMQATYHIMKDLLEAGHWELADKYLTPEYLQHNPNAKSGRDAVVYYFTKVRKVEAKPIPERLGTPIVAVVAQGDYVTVAYPHVMKDEKDPTKNYSTTWFDMWRFKDGKADEHWDPATKQ